MLGINLLAALSVTDARTVAASVIACLIALLCIAVVVVVMLQKSANEGARAITGGSSESFFAKNKGDRTSRLLRILTIVFASLAAVLAIVFFVVAPTVAVAPAA